MQIDEIFLEAVGGINYYFSDVLSWPFSTTITIIAIGIPVLHVMRGKKDNWTQPGRVLLGYVSLMILSFLALYALGITLHETAPTTFETWRRDSNSGLGYNPATLLFKLVIALPFAFGVSSVVYGALGGWNKFWMSLLGVMAAFGLVVMAFGGTLLRLVVLHLGL
jgi:hypothetical protein